MELKPIPDRMTRSQAADYLKDICGMPASMKTLAQYANSF